MAVLRNVARGARGSNNAAAALSESDVLTIRRLYAGGQETYGSLARIYLVSGETIRRIITGETWSWLRGEGDLPAGSALTTEVSEEEVQASKARFEALLKEATEGETRGDEMLKELDAPEGLGPEAQARFRALTGKD